MTACAYNPPRGGADTDPDAGDLGDAGVDAGDIVVGDAGVDPDAPPPTGTPVTLAQTTGGSTVKAIGCSSTGDQTIFDNAWYRVFPLADYGVVGSFALTKVSFWVRKTQGLRDAVLSVGAYTGPFQGPTFQTALFQSLGGGGFKAPVTTPNGQLVTVRFEPPLVIDAVAHPQIAIRLSSSDMLLGSSGGPQTAHGYFGTSMCNLSTSMPPQSGSFFILTAEGTTP